MRRTAFLFVCVVASLALSACGPGQLFGPTLTPTPTITFTPTSTFTPLPTETATLTPLPPPAAAPTQPAVPPVVAPVSGNLLLYESFVDNARGWTGLYPGAEVLIQNNKLKLTSTQAGQPAVVYCSGVCGPYQLNYYYQAELVEEASSTIGFGLVFGMDPQNNAFYAYLIRPSSGEFSLLKLMNGVWTPLLDWTASTTINLFPQPNILGAGFQDGNIDLYINNIKIASYADGDPFNSGRIGFYVDQEGMSLLASNVAVFFQEMPSPTPASLFTPTATLRPTLAHTATYTPEGACPPSVPKGTWALVITNSSFKKKTIYVNGAKTLLQPGPNAIYLKLKQTHSLEIDGKTSYVKQEICKIVYMKVK